MKETLQEKIKECLPKELGEEEESRELFKSGYSVALSDVHSSIPKVLEVIREMVVKEIPYLPSSEFTSIEYYHGRNDTRNQLNDLLK